MPRINLLPWRDEERKERKLKFLVALGGAAVGACLTAFVGFLMMDSMISAQEARNQRLTDQIAELDKQIEKINSLEADKARFIARMEVIEKLQRSRPEIVHIFDEIAKQLPDGVYLTGITQTGARLKFEGVAQSSTRVSAFMRNIDASSYLKNPELDIVETKKNNVTGATFILFAEQAGSRRARGRYQAEAPCCVGGSRTMSILDDLKSLDPNDPGRWPLPVRIGSVVVCFVVLASVLFYFLVWSDKKPELDRVAAEEQALRNTFKSKHSKAVNLEIYQQQLADIERSFGALLRQLPGRTEVPNLLVDISQVGVGAGLEEKLFQPSAEVKKDFYAELPIKIRLTGSYHQMGEFVSGIAALPRIVTLHEMTIKPENKDLYDNLSFELTAKTFRYLDDAEVAAAEKAKTPAKPGT